MPAIDEDNPYGSTGGVADPRNPTAAPSPLPPPKGGGAVFDQSLPGVAAAGLQDYLSDPGTLQRIKAGTVTAVGMGLAPFTGGGSLALPGLANYYAPNAMGIPGRDESTKKSLVQGAPQQLYIGAKAQSGEPQTAATPIVPPPAGTRTIPAHSIDLVDPEMQKNYRGFRTQEADAIRRTGGAQREYSRLEAEANSQGADQMINAAQQKKQQAAELLDNVKVRDEELKRFAGEKQRFADKLYEDTKGEKDPYTQIPAFSRVGAAIADALSAFATGFSGGKSNFGRPGTDAIRARIADIVQQQRQRFEAGKEKLNSLDKAYSEAAQRFGSLNSADQVMASHLWEAAKDETQAMALKANSPVIAQKGEILATEMQAKADDAQALSTKDQMAMRKYVPEQKVSTGPNAAQIEKIRKEYADRTESLIKEGYTPQQAQGLAAAMVRGASVPENAPAKPGKEAAAGKRTPEQARAEIVKAVDRLRELNKDAGMLGLIDPDKRAEAAALRATIQEQLPFAQIGSTRTPSEAAMKLQERRLPNLGTPGAPGARNTQLDVLKKSMQGPAPEAQPEEFSPDKEEK